MMTAVSTACPKSFSPDAPPELIKADPTHESVDDLIAAEIDRMIGAREVYIASVCLPNLRALKPPLLVGSFCFTMSAQ